MGFILALDVGITTGYALLRHAPATEDLAIDLEEFGTFEAPVAETVVKKLRNEYMPRWSVAEMPVIHRGKLGDQLQVVGGVVRRELMRQVQEVDAAAWKQTPFKSAKVPKGISQHERDAIRLALWYRNIL